MSEAIDDLENNRDEEYLRLSPFFDVDLEEQKELLEDPQTAREILKQMKEARDKLANYLARFADNTASEIIQELKANHQNVLNQLKDEIQSEDNEMNQID
jgi:gas vesicle protein